MSRLALLMLLGLAACAPAGQSLRATGPVTISAGEVAVESAFQRQPVVEQRMLDRQRLATVQFRLIRGAADFCPARTPPFYGLHVAPARSFRVRTRGPARDETIVASIAAACREAGCALLGGETAIHPGVLEPAQFDVAGAAIGVVERSAIPDPASVAVGDLVIGVASPNVRSNGFSLVRSIFDAEDLASPVPGTNRTVGDVLLEPSVLYAPAVLAVAGQVDVHGFVHVTGGGIPGNVPRALPEGLGATIDTTAWVAPAIFDLIARRGGVEPTEMLRTFNMGVGFVLIVDPARSEDVIDVLADHDRSACVIGEIVPGSEIALV